MSKDIRLCERVRKYIPTYKKVWKRLKDDKFGEDYFDDVLDRNEKIDEEIFNGVSDRSDAKIPMPGPHDTYNECSAFWFHLRQDLIEFGVLIRSEKEDDEELLKKKDNFWRLLLKDVDNFHKNY